MDRNGATNRKARTLCSRFRGSVWTRAAAILLASCGGSTQVLGPGVEVDNDGGALGAGSDAANVALDASNVGTSDGSGGGGMMPFNPGSLGGILPAMGGTGAADGGAGSVGAVLAGLDDGGAGGLLGSAGLAFSDAGVIVAADGGPIEVYGTGISAQVVTGCTQLCAKQATAMCPDAGSTQSCDVGCELVAGNPACATQAQNLFTCASSNSPSCDSGGNATFAGCGVEYVSSAACLVSSTADSALAAPCSAYCAKVAAAACPNDGTDCDTGCQMVGGLLPACAAAWKNYVQCAASATLRCDSSGKASAPGCAAQAIAFIACAGTGLSSLSGMGQ